jgi:predicted phosphodiesterase
MKNRLIFGIIIFFLASCGSGCQQLGSMLMRPYLQAVTQNNISVMVESSSTDSVTVDYGLTIAYGMTARTESVEWTTDSTYVHNVKLTGLTPNTIYHYRAVQNVGTSSDAAFRTAVRSGTPFRFAWLADPRTNTAAHDRIAKLIADANPVVSLYGGDIARNSEYDAFKMDFFRPNELALISRVPFYNAPGNHEGWKTNTKAFTRAPFSPSGTQDFYSVDYGDMHLLVLNTELPLDEKSPQYIFAEKDLASTAQTWKIVIAHNHAYCSGGHGENADLKRMSTNIFETNKVDMVISGHSHFYQHNLVNGIHHMIIGSAGAPLKTPKDTSYTLKSVKDYNFAIVDVSPETFMMVIYNAEGAVLDSVMLRKGNSIGSDKSESQRGSHIRLNYLDPSYLLERREHGLLEIAPATN